MAKEWKSITHTLSHPVTVGERSYSTVTLREPNVAAIEMVEESGLKAGVEPTNKQLRIAIMALSGLPAEVVREFHKDDFAEVVAAAIPLLLPTSEPSPTESSDGTISTPSSEISPTG